MALISVSGHLKDPSGNGIAGSIVFQLVNYGAAIPRVIGTNALVPTNVTFTAAANGAWSGNIQGNDSIDPGALNTPPTTYYTVQFRDANGAEIQTVAFNFTGAGPANLDSQAPLVTIPSPTAPPSTAALIAGNNTFTGPNKFTDLYQFDSLIVVDGVTYPFTDVGISNAITASGSNGAVWLMPGTYSLASTITVSAQNVALMGFSPFATHLQVNHTNDVFVITGQVCQMSGFAVEINTATTRSGSTVWNIQSAQGTVRNCRVIGNASSVTNGALGSLLSSAAGAWTFDTVYVTQGTWTSGWTMRAASGTIAGTYFNNIYTFVGSTYTDSVYIADTGVDTILFNNIQAGQSGRSLHVQNSLSGQAARWIFAQNFHIEAGGPTSGNVCVQIEDVRVLHFIDGQISSAQNALVLNGGNQIHFDNVDFVNIGQHGIVHTATPVNVLVSGCSFEDIGTNTTNTYDYVNIAGGTQSFTYRDNNFRQLNANKARYGFNLLTGGTTNFEISGNDFFQAGIGTAYLSNLASGGSQTFEGNRPESAFNVKLSGPVILDSTVSGATLTGASSGNSVTLLNAQANAAAITGTGAAAILYTYTLPANTVATLKGIRIRLGFNHSTGTASVTYSITLNGVAVSTQSSATTGQGIFEVLVLNTASTTGTQTGIFGVASSPNLVTGTLTGLAWTSNQIINANFNVAATDQVTPIFWLAELIQ